MLNFMHKHGIPEEKAFFWTTVEIRLELMKHLDQATPHFQERLKQILLDMRLQHESLDSLLKMIFNLLEHSDAQSLDLFVTNVERVAFDPRLSPTDSDPLISFLKRIQRKKAV